MSGRGRTRVFFGLELSGVTRVGVGGTMDSFLACNGLTGSLLIGRWRTRRWGEGRAPMGWLSGLLPLGLFGVDVHVEPKQVQVLDGSHIDSDCLYGEHR